MVSAALRHARDAEVLATNGSPGRSLDQAYHLAGFGPECARKATLALRTLDKTIGHRFDDGADDVLDLAEALDPLCHRYRPRDWTTRWPSLAGWSEQVRYDRTGTHDEAKVLRLVGEARDAVDAVVLALWADGRLPPMDGSW